MESTTIKINSLGKEVEVEFEIEPGQESGSMEREDIPRSIYDIYTVTFINDKGEKTACDISTLHVLGIMDEIWTELEELLEKGDL